MSTKSYTSEPPERLRQCPCCGAKFKKARLSLVGVTREQQDAWEYVYECGTVYNTHCEEVFEPSPVCKRLTRGKGDEARRIAEALPWLKQLRQHWLPHGDIDNQQLTQEGNWTLKQVCAVIDILEGKTTVTREQLVAEAKERGQVLIEKECDGR